MCACTCVWCRLCSHVSSLVGGAQQENQVFGKAWCHWGIRVAFGQAAKPRRRVVVPVRGEVKRKLVAMANGKVLLRPDLLRDEPLVIST